MSQSMIMGGGGGKQLDKPSNSFFGMDESYIRNSDVAVLDYSPKNIIITEDIDIDREDVADSKPDKADADDKNPFEPEPETDKINSLPVSAIDECGEEELMLQLNHKSLRLLQAQIIDFIEQIG